MKKCDWLNGVLWMLIVCCVLLEVTISYAACNISGCDASFPACASSGYSPSTGKCMYGLTFVGACNTGKEGCNECVCESDIKEVGHPCHCKVK
jgi:hypothetical protein